MEHAWYPLFVFLARAWRRNILSCLLTGNSRRIRKKQNTTCGGQTARDTQAEWQEAQSKAKYVMYLYYILLGIFNKLNFLKPPKNKMHFPVFILRYFPVFTNWMDFWFVLPRLLLGFSKMSIHEIFLVVLMVFILTLIKKKIFPNTLGSSSVSFFLLSDTLYTLWVWALFS